MIFAKNFQAISLRQQQVQGWGPVIEGRGRWTRRAHRFAQLGGQRDLRRLTSRRVTLPTPVLFGCCMAFRADALRDIDAGGAGHLAAWQTGLRPW